jgi:hypothetical protein
MSVFFVERSRLKAASAAPPWRGVGEVFLPFEIGTA